MASSWSSARLLRTSLPFANAAIGSAQDRIAPRMRRPRGFAYARFVNLDAETTTLERLDHAFLHPEHFRVFEIGQQIVLTGVVMNPQGHFLNHEIGRQQSKLHTGRQRDWSERTVRRDGDIIGLRGR